MWGDRATFHSLVSDVDRSAYLTRLKEALAPGGHASWGLSPLDGPERCSGLTVMRYDVTGLAKRSGKFLSVNPTYHLLAPRGCRAGLPVQRFQARGGYSVTGSCPRATLSDPEGVAEADWKRLNRSSVLDGMLTISLLMAALVEMVENGGWGVHEEDNVDRDEQGIQRSVLHLK